MSNRQAGKARGAGKSAGVGAGAGKSASAGKNAGAGKSTGAGTALPAGLSSPARRALASAGYVWLEQFAAVSEAEVLQLHGMGPKAMGLLRAALADIGLAFKQPK